LDFNTDLGLLPEDIAVRIIKKIAYYLNTPDPIKHAKALSGKLQGYYRYRIGDYRAIFSVDSDHNLIILVMLRVKHRKDAYNL